ncbi:hypothetical protein CVV72_11370 [Amycolatopsis sp. TNS106]|nr:hypothetical protein CVV72_11370 [Amycolatopsis sp. TNS106]
MLGALEVQRDTEPILIKAGKHRVLLASLLIDAGQMVSTPVLLDRLWGGHPPAGARNTLQNYVLRLRRSLGEAALIVTSSQGYAIEVERQAIDLFRFGALTDNARKSVAKGELRQASDLLDEALGLWRGEALSDVPSDLLHTEFTPGLAERRLAAVELRLDLDLLLGRQREALTELHALTTTYPLRERFWSQRILALYRTGRQSEALDAYRTVSRILSDELGVDPGHELRELHAKILASDPSLNHSASIENEPVTQSRREESSGVENADRQDPVVVSHHGLPADLADFTGRRTETSHVMDIASTKRNHNAPVVIAIDGMAGVGKTAFAVHVAHLLTERYPDAQFYLDLHGHTPGQQPMDTSHALYALLRAAGIPTGTMPETVETRAALWRNALARRRVIVLLDNVADNVHIAPLLPAGPDCAVMITSRHRLLGIDGVHHLTIDPLPPEDGGLLLTRIAAGRGADADQAVIAEIVRLCGALPLAIRLAGARLSRSWPLTRLRNRLRGERTIMPRLRAGDRSIAAAFGVSYHRLPPVSRQAFHLLSLHLGPDLDRFEAAAILATSPDEADEQLDLLTDTSLLQADVAGRYRFHDLLRSYARERGLALEPRPLRRQAQSRVLEYYLRTMAAAHRRFFPHSRVDAGQLGVPKGFVRTFDGFTEFADWCHVDHDSLSLTLHHDSRAAETPEARVSIADWEQLYRPGTTGRPPTGQSERAADDALAAEARVLHGMGTLQYWLGQYKQGENTLREALALCRDLGDRRREGAILQSLGDVAIAAGRSGDAVSRYRASCESRRALGDAWGEAVALNSLGGAHRMSGDHEAALDFCTAALRLHRESGSRWGEGVTLHHLGLSHRCLGDRKESLACLTEAVTALRECGDQFELASALVALGCAAQDNDNPIDAADLWEEALQMLELLADPTADTVRGYLAELSA